MKTVYRLNNKKITKKEATAMFGKERLDYYLKEARKAYRSDPYELSSWYTSNGMFDVIIDADLEVE